MHKVMWGTSFPNSSLNSSREEGGSSRIASTSSFMHCCAPLWHLRFSSFVFTAASVRDPVAVLDPDPVLIVAVPDKSISKVYARFDRSYSSRVRRKELLSCRAARGFLGLCLWLATRFSWSSLLLSYSMSLVDVSLLKPVITSSALWYYTVGQSLWPLQSS